MIPIKATNTQGKYAGNNINAINSMGIIYTITQAIASLFASLCYGGSEVTAATRSAIASFHSA